MVADIDKSIARDYGVLLNDSVALRGTFVIDKDGVVQSAVVNNLPIGRSISETIRVVAFSTPSSMVKSAQPTGAKATKQ